MEVSSRLAFGNPNKESNAKRGTRNHVATTYNFAVADYHTYFVGPQGLWAHNMCADDVPAPRKRPRFDWRSYKYQIFEPEEVKVILRSGDGPHMISSVLLDDMRVKGASRKRRFVEVEGRCM